MISRAILLTVLFSIVYGWTAYQTSDMFFWSSSNGNNVLILADGTVATVGVQWVGLSAWYDLAGIKAWYTTIVAAGQIPYFHDYSLGTIIYNTRNISYAGILQFDLSLAQMIGSNFAIVNLDTEWGM
jgi:hypothetical protein